LYQVYSVNARAGLDCCAPDSISFHYIDSPALMICVHAVMQTGRESG
jgi:hypothetical protein